MALQVSDKARFKRWYDPGCLPNWILGSTTERPGGSDGLSPYFASLLTITYASGDWLETMSFVPYQTDTQMSARAAKEFDKLYRHGGRVCPSPPKGAG
jgi:hypothetical protein